MKSNLETLRALLESYTEQRPKTEEELEEFISTIRILGSPVPASWRFAIYSELLLEALRDFCLEIEEEENGKRE